MKLTERHATSRAPGVPLPESMPSHAAGPNDEFGSLSGLFRARLQSERVHFVSLSAALAQAEDSPGNIFEAVAFRAHRLKGTAAIFEFKDVAAAAHGLEHAAKAAVATRAANTDAAVWAALVALVSLLADFEGGTPALPGFEAATG